MKEATDQAREQGLATLHPLEGEDWQRQFLVLLAHADATTATAQAPPGKKGRRKQSAARNGLPRLIEEQEAVLAFLHRLVVPFDTNQAERDVRMVKVHEIGLWLLPQPSGGNGFLSHPWLRVDLAQKGAWIYSPP